MKSKDWLVFLGLALAWGSSFFWIKIALSEVGPFLLVALRVLFGILGLLVVYFLRKSEWPRDKALIRNLLILGITNTALPFALISWAELHIDSAVASILNSSVPLFTTVIAHFMLSDDKMSVRRVAGLLVGFVGVALLVLRDVPGDVRLNLLAQGAMILAVLFYAGSAVFARSRTKGTTPVVQALIPLLSADAFIWASALAVESPLHLPQMGITWVALAWLGLVGSCAAYLFYYYLIHSVGPTRTTMVTYTFPVVGVTLGVLFLGEALDWHLVLGGLLILASLLIVNRG
ncbi:MAG: DMT family transporter [Anaerolineales bacterium]|jgi:drug/metabolite transporter (DMT)-like permease|nr:DMT family transporter [Anaerolineales bacterium]